MKLTRPTGLGCMEWLAGMSADNDKDLKLTQELYDFLQGKMPEGTHVARSHRPKLTPDQAWTVVWYLGNQYWQVTDRVEKCCVCGDLYHTWQGGDCLDYGKAPYHFCDSCMSSDEYAKKAADKRNPANGGTHAARTQDVERTSD